MKIKKSKLLYLISAVLILSILSTALIFSSCKNNGDGRESFSPESGAYEITLTPGEWTTMTGLTQNSDNLSLVHIQSGALFNTDCYNKSATSGLGITDLNGFIDYYKALDISGNPYKAGTDISIGDLTDINKSDFKGSVATLGKSQTITAKYNENGTENTIDVTTNVIYLEGKTHYFIVYYSVTADKLQSAQTGAKELISHITTEK